MFSMLAAASAAFMAMAILVTLAVVALFVKFAVKLLLLPLLLVKWLVMSVEMLVVGPILFVVGVILTVVFGLVIAVPLLPLLGIAAVIWMIARASRPAVA